MPCSDLANSCAAGNILCIVIGSSGIAAELAQDVNISAFKSSRARQNIGGASTTQGAGASRWVFGSKELSGNIRINGATDAIKDIAFCENICTRIDLKCMPSGIDIAPVVIDRMQNCFPAYFGTAARGVVDIISLERDLVVGAEKEDRPRRISTLNWKSWILHVRHLSTEAGFYAEKRAGSRLNSLRTMALREAAAHALTSCKGAVVLC